VLILIVALFLAVFYRYGPNRETPYWQWVSWGSVLASVLWLGVTALFFVYARYFADFSDSYSVFAGIIVLMTWLNLTAFIVLLGAEVNNRLEKQTSEATTKG
jgi:membrane protein